MVAAASWDARVEIKRPAFAGRGCGWVFERDAEIEHAIIFLRLGGADFCEMADRFALEVFDSAFVLSDGDFIDA